MQPLDDPESWLQEARRRYSGAEPTELHRYFSNLTHRRPYFSGTTVPVLTSWVYRLRPSGLFVPERHDTTILDGEVKTYVTSDEYLNMPPDLAVTSLVTWISRTELLGGLAVLNWLLGDERIDQWQHEYVSNLAPVLRERIVAAMRRDGVARAFLSRQGILQAARVVLCYGSDDANKPGVPSLVVATALTHAVSAFLQSHRDDDVSLPDVFSSVGIELAQNAAFNQSDDTLALIARTSVLWRHYGRRIETYPLRADPDDMLSDITGLETEAWLALGFAFYSRAHGWKPGNPVWLPTDLDLALPQSTMDAFLRRVASDVDSLADAVSQPTSPWGLLPFQSTPLVRSGNLVLVLDPTYLLERVTSGLFWLVHDHERDRFGSKARRRWTQAWGEMVELMVQDQVRSLALPVADGGNSTFYHPSAFERAYRGQNIPDAAIDFGIEFCLFEVVSGHLSVPLRFDGNREAFERDTERLVLKKARQLDGVVNCVLGDESKLTGIAPVFGRRIIPVVVVGDGYPLNPFTHDYIMQRLATEGLFSDARSYPLAIISVAELEMLQGLAEHGVSVAEELVAWLTSPQRQLYMRNFLIRRHRHLDAKVFRPRHLVEEFDRVTRDILSRLSIERRAA